jgi:hypothetical protein
MLQEGTSSRFRQIRAMLYRDGQPALDLTSSEWFGVRRAWAALQSNWMATARC